MERIDLKRLRFENHLTQEELGNILGYTKQHIGRIESGQSKLSEEKIDILKQHFPLMLQDNQNKENQIIGSSPLCSKVTDDIVKIPYWSGLPEELKHREYTYVIAQRVSIEQGWNLKPESLCITIMNGDTMENFWYKIRNNDILIVDTSETKVNANGSGVYFATSRGNSKFWIREMTETIDDGIEFKAYAPSGVTVRVLTKQQLIDADFKVIGRVIKNVSFRL